MTIIAAQISLYPLGRNHLGPAIREAIATLRTYRLEVQPGAMSTMITGDDAEVFDALRHVFARLAVQGPVVMTLAVSNACPLPATQEAAEEA
jgi:uncharacterized protein YqgV (UPF0045/DUF77 family)